MKCTEIINNPFEGLCTSKVGAKNVPQHATEVAHYVMQIGESRATRMARLYPFGIRAVVPKLLRDLLVMSIDGIGVGHVKGRNTFYTLSDYTLDNTFVI